MATEYTCIVSVLPTGRTTDFDIYPTTVFVSFLRRLLDAPLGDSCKFDNGLERSGLTMHQAAYTVQEKALECTREQL